MQSSIDYKVAPPPFDGRDAQWATFKEKLTNVAICAGCKDGLSNNLDLSKDPDKKLNFTLAQILSKSCENAAPKAARAVRNHVGDGQAIWKALTEKYESTGADVKRKIVRARLNDLTMTKYGSDAKAFGELEQIRRDGDSLGYTFTDQEILDAFTTAFYNSPYVEIWINRMITIIMIIIIII